MFHMEKALYDFAIHLVAGHRVFLRPIPPEGWGNEGDNKSQGWTHLKVLKEREGMEGRRDRLVPVLPDGPSRNHDALEYPAV